MEALKRYFFDIVLLLLTFLCRDILSTPLSDNLSVLREIQSSQLSVRDDYLNKRQKLLTAEQQQRVGGELVLSKAEQIVNERLSKMKQSEIDNAHYHGKPFGPQINFLKSKSLYEQSDVFKMIKSMPKGKSTYY